MYSYTGVFKAGPRLFILFVQSTCLWLFAGCISLASLAGPSTAQSMLTAQERNDTWEIRGKDSTKTQVDCVVKSFNPNPIASSRDPRKINDLRALGAEMQDIALSGVGGLEEGVLRNEWISISTDDGKPYLEGATCEDLNFDWRDHRFAYLSTYVAIDRTINWLSKNGMEFALPKNLDVHVSDSITQTYYEAGSRRLYIGSRQCSENYCPCGERSGLDCPKSKNGRSVWSHAQDQDVVIHEYAHAILHYLTCSDSSGCELPAGIMVAALDEGFADYVASAVNTSLSGQKNDPYSLGEWYNAIQGHPGFYLRQLDSDAHWPESARSLKAAQPYSYSTLWTSALLRARYLLPDSVMDQIVLKAYTHLERDMTFELMARKIVAAASEIEGGIYEPIVRSTLKRQGFISEISQFSLEPKIVEHKACEIALDTWTLPAYPSFDNTQKITVSGAKGIQLQFDRIRLRNGDCFNEYCGRIYVCDEKGDIYDIIDGPHDDYTTVIVPGETIILHFIASFDHTRTVVYQVKNRIAYFDKCCYSCDRD